MTEPETPPPENGEQGDSPYEDAQEVGYEGEQTDLPDEHTTTGQFKPRLEEIAPDTGSAGDEIAIVGDGLTTTSSVTFGGVDAEFTVENEHRINATVPDGTGTVDVAVSTPNGSTDLGDAFAYKDQ